ncbi:hypothetical protein [Actinokineospora xionganensis]|uniref:PPE family protein n=1 Tax=Actinokineospora xionganensis TaxID=2684470 RepID=A0ABR7L8U4_9PSEU|nr:hypothetical protein [Actinokineospora xionganensis]MBC6449105.1 hypothetical protein [Actinokineospora xionganensis]
MSAYEIYQALRVRARGTGSMHDASSLAAEEAKLEEVRAERVLQLSAKIAAGWEGAAGDAALGSAKPLIDVSKIGAENLERTTKILESQSDGFHAASSAVRPVAENPPETGFMGDVEPWFTDTPTETEKYEADSLNNLRVYEAYDHQSMAHDEALPMDYSYIQDPGGSIGIEPPVKNPPDDPGGGGDKDPYTPPGRVDEGRDKWTPPPVKPIDPVDPRPVEPVDPTKPQQVDETKPNQHIQTKPDPVQVRPLPTDHPGPSNQNNNIYGPGGTGTGRGGDGTGGGRGSGGPGGLRGGGGGAGGAGGSGMRGGGFGSGTGEHGPGGRSGALGAGGDHGPGGRGGAAGAGGRGGGAGMGGGMGGGGRGQGGEDEEHTRASFLQEDDPEAIFGTDQITAPPVIGG